MFAFTALNYTTDPQVLMTGEVRERIGTVHSQHDRVPNIQKLTLHRRPVSASMVEPLQ